MTHRFVMGANYHGGEQVLNYPWDAVAAPGDPMIPAYAPDDQLFFDFGTGLHIRVTQTCGITPALSMASPAVGNGTNLGRYAGLGLLLPW